MPATWEDAFYLILYMLIVAGVGVLVWLVNKGFGGIMRMLNTLEGGLSGLRSDLQREREDRITLYGELKASQAAHRAVCDERHR